MTASQTLATSPTRRERRLAAARQVLAVCADVDAVTLEAQAAIGMDDGRLFALLETRELMLQDLSEQMAVLHQTRPAADDPLLAATERSVDDADALLANVCEALAGAERSTRELAARVARRVESLRTELANMSRASQVGSAYQLGAQARLVDLRR